MATNTLLTTDEITKEALSILHSKLNFIPNMTRGYDSSFGVAGAKIGDALRIRLPAQYSVRSGTMTMSAVDTVESSVTLKVDQVTGVDLEFTAQELALDINDFGSLVLEPAMSKIAAKIEASVIGKAVLGAGGGLVTASPTALDFLKANAALTDRAVPLSQRGAWIAPLVEAGIVDALKSVFNDVKEVSRQYLEGSMGRALGLDWYGNVHIPTITNPATDLAGAVKTTVSKEGANEIVVKSFTAADVVPAGALFTVAGVNSVNPETKADTGKLKVFVNAVASTVDASGDGKLTCSEKIYTTGGSKNCTAFPTANGVVTILGVAGTSYRTNLVAQKEFLAFGTADLEVPNGVEDAARYNYDGISINYVRAFDISSRKSLARFDVVWGCTILRPEAGVLVNSAI